MVGKREAEPVLMMVMMMRGIRVHVLFLERDVGVGFLCLWK